jgi:outer membrane protein TolC
LFAAAIVSSVLQGAGASAQTPPAVAPQEPASPSGVPLSILDAVRTTLRMHPAIQAASAQLHQRHAELDVARGPFDPVLTASASQTRSAVPVLPGAAAAPGEQSLLTDTSALNLGASMATTWGTSISPSVGLSRVYQRPGEAIAPIPGLMTDPGQFALVSLNVVQPLLRGAGTVGAASAIAAAKLARDAAAHNVEGTAQAQVFMALVAYFQLVAATQDLALLRAAESASRKVVDETRALVEGHQRPRSDLPSLEGNLANRVRMVTEAEDSRQQALHALGLAIGLGAKGTPDFQATDGFPDPSTSTPDQETIVRLAHRDRADLQALHESVASAAEALRGAEHNTLPSLDLSMSVGYAGALERDGVGPFFGALAANVPGPNGSVGLSLALPVRNTAQEANRDLKRSLREQAEVAERDAERQLPVAVASALDELRLSRTALAASAEAVKQFGQAVDDQREKLREGVGTVIDLVLTEQLLIAAEQNRTATQLRFSTALARVVFEMGALPSSERDASEALARLLGVGGAHAGQ